MQGFVSVIRHGCVCVCYNKDAAVSPARLVRGLTKLSWKRGSVVWRRDFVGRPAQMATAWDVALGLRVVRCCVRCGTTFPFGGGGGGGS